MKRSIETLVFLTGITFAYGEIYINNSVAAQDNDVCFMVNSSGRVVNLNRLCSGTSGSTARPANPGLFQVPIKRRQGGTPVIDVTFNDRNTFEMLFDTGASLTTITPPMANALRLVPTGVERARVASGEIVEFPMGRVTSITVGGVVINNAVVSVGAVPLLGQNFFGNYDVTIKQNVVEFRVR